METSNKDEQYNLPSQVESADTNRTFNDLTIRKNRGFFGVTLPVMTRVEGATAQTAANFTTPFFIANRPYQILEVIERHETAGTDGSAVTVMVKKTLSGTAPASGTDILTAGLSLKATANTNQSGVISRAADTLAYGDSLTLVSTGTLTNLVGVTVYVLLKAI